MNYRVEWSSKAVGDLAEHVAFQKKVSLEAAAAVASNVIAKANSLIEFPERFPEFPMPRNFPFPIRKCVVDGRYILLYGVNATTVLVYRILDARRKFDGLLR